MYSEIKFLFEALTLYTPPLRSPIRWKILAFVQGTVTTKVYVSMSRLKYGGHHLWENYILLSDEYVNLLKNIHND